jgi:hypothetical protein
LATISALTASRALPPQAAMAWSVAISIRAASAVLSGAARGDIGSSELTEQAGCSHFVLVESSGQTRRFPAPWRVEQVDADCYEIRDANGFRLASVHCRDDLQKWSFGHSHLTSDEARRIANAIARLPELLMQRRGFYPRGGGHDRWEA